MDTRIPILTPLLSLARSRKVLVALVAIIMSLLVAAVPTLEAVRGELFVIFVTLALVLVGGITVEDAVKVGREESTAPARPTNDYVRELIEALVDEALGKRADALSKQVAQNTASLKVVSEEIFHPPTGVMDVPFDTPHG